MKDTRPDQGSGALAAVSARAAMDSIRSTNRASTNSSLVPNRGTHPDPGVTRDLVEADLKTALVTDLHGGRPEALPVPLGVPPQRPRRIGDRERIRRDRRHKKIT
jgi:hypothetical protein